MRPCPLITRIPTPKLHRGTLTPPPRSYPVGSALSVRLLGPALGSSFMRTAPSAPLDRIGVGIDTARYGHRVSFLRPDRQAPARPMTVLENHAGPHPAAQPHGPRLSRTCYPR